MSVRVCENTDSYATSDGTWFAVADEQVRGEPRFYWVQRKPPDSTPAMTLLGTGTHDKRTAQRRAKRCAEEWGGKTPTTGGESE
jgi:hypothetical protein